MEGRLQKVAALFAVASAFGACAHADGPIGLFEAVGAANRLDPFATVETRQVGLRERWPLGISTTLSLFSMKSDAHLFIAATSGITEYDRPTLRQGAQFTARYEPSHLLAFDLQASAGRARFAGGAKEYVSGAVERNVTAAATLRMPNGWNASMLVNFPGATVASNAFLNARLARSFSKDTRVSLDIFNVLDRRTGNLDYFSASNIWSAPGAEGYLFNPAESRGLRLKLRTTF